MIVIQHESTSMRIYFYGIMLDHIIYHINVKAVWLQYVGLWRRTIR